MILWLLLWTYFYLRWSLHQLEHRDIFVFVSFYLSVDVAVFHSSTLERRYPVQMHPHQQALLPAQSTQQELDNEMVEILIWPDSLEEI